MNKEKYGKLQHRWALKWAFKLLLENRVEVIRASPAEAVLPVAHLPEQQTLKW